MITFHWCGRFPEEKCKKDGAARVAFSHFNPLYLRLFTRLLHCWPIARFFSCKTSLVAATLSDITSVRAHFSRQILSCWSHISLQFLMRCEFMMFLLGRRSSRLTDKVLDFPEGFMGSGDGLRWLLSVCVCGGGSVYQCVAVPKMLNNINTFFRYHLFSIPIPVVFSLPIFSHTTRKNEQFPVPVSIWYRYPL